VKTYAAPPVEALNKKERQGETQFATKTEVPAPLNVNVFNIFESHPIYDQTEGCSAVFVTLYMILLYIFDDKTILQKSYELVVGVYFDGLFFFFFFLQCAI
jgi:hypothetical protein